MGKQKNVVAGFTCFVCEKATRTFMNALNKPATDFTCGDDYCAEFLAKHARDERLGKLTTFASKLFARPDIDKKLDSYKTDVANCCAAAAQRTTALREEAANAERGQFLDELLHTARSTEEIQRKNVEAVAEKEEAVEAALANAAALTKPRSRVSLKSLHAILLLNYLYSLY
jgi:oligoendopeptidase F